MLSSTLAEADLRARVVDVHGQSYVLRGYVGAAPVRGTYIEGNEANASPLPQGFLVDQPPDSVTPPHFHETAQFQVFVAGSGRLGKKPAAPVTVQFAGGHTPYGPIVAGPEGVRYFTLRQRWDPGAKYMPAMREHLQRGRQRPRQPAPVGVEGSRLVEWRGARETALIPAEPDGLYACLLRLGPGVEAPAPAPALGGGQYHVVIGGGLATATGELSVLTCQFIFPDERPGPVRAGDSGLELLCLRFPRAAHEPASTTQD